MSRQKKYYAENIIKAGRYLVAAVVLAVAGAVYEYFSHGVYSHYMIYAFMIPLVMGCMPYLLDSRGIMKTAGPVAGLFLNAAIVTLSVGSIIKGILEIYGTTNRLTFVYAPLGAAMIIASLTVCIINMRLKRAAGD